MLIGYRAGEFGNRARTRADQHTFREDLRRERQREQEAAATTEYLDHHRLATVERRIVGDGWC